MYVCIYISIYINGHPERCELERTNLRNNRRCVVAQNWKSVLAPLKSRNTGHFLRSINVLNTTQCYGGIE